MSESECANQPYSKEALFDKLDRNRLRIRESHHRKILEQHREHILNVMFPLRSRTFEQLQGVPAAELRFLVDELNSQLRNERMTELSDEDQRDLVDDLYYLCAEADFQVSFPLRLNHNEDPYVCEFVCSFFRQLPPNEVDYWLPLMTVEQRTDLYCCLDCTEQKSYFTNTLLGCLVEDFDQREAVELMCEFVDESQHIHRLVTIKLIEKLVATLQQKPRSFAYVHLGVSIYIRFCNEAFAVHLLDQLFLHIGEETPLDELDKYIVAINHLQEARPAISLHPTVTNAIFRLERLLTDERVQHIIPFINNRHALKMLIKCIENHRKQRKEYHLQAATLMLLERQQPSNDTIHLAQVLRSRASRPSTNN